MRGTNGTNQATSRYQQIVSGRPRIMKCPVPSAVAKFHAPGSLSLLKMMRACGPVWWRYVEIVRNSANVAVFSSPLETVVKAVILPPAIGNKGKFPCRLSCCIHLLCTGSLLIAWSLHLLGGLTDSNSIQ